MLSAVLHRSLKVSSVGARAVCAGSSLLRLGMPGSARPDREVLALIMFPKSMQQNAS